MKLQMKLRTRLFLGFSALMTVALLGLLLERILEQAGGEFAGAGPAQLDQAAWVGWRLAELLPLDEEQRLVLLQEDDPHRRLEQLLTWIPDFEPPPESDL